MKIDDKNIAAKSKPVQNRAAIEPGEQPATQLRREFLKKFGAYAVGGSLGFTLLAGPQKVLASTGCGNDCFDPNSFQSNEAGYLEYVEKK